MRLMRLLGSLALASLAGCSSFLTVPPAVKIEVDVGEVRAPSGDQAAELASWVAQIDPEVRALLGTEGKRLVVWQSAEEAPGITVAVATTERIVIGSEQNKSTSFALAHELAHWHATGLWDNLPQVVEEGLCDLVACEALGVSNPDSDGYRFLLALEGKNVDLEHELSRTASNYRDGGELELQVSYALGFALASKIGVDGLRRLCAEQERDGGGTIPPERILAAAGLDSQDVASWGAAIPPSFAWFELVFTGPGGFVHTLVQAEGKGTPPIPKGANQMRFGIYGGGDPHGSMTISAEAE